MLHAWKVRACFLTRATTPLKCRTMTLYLLFAVELLRVVQLLHSLSPVSNQSSAVDRNAHSDCYVILWISVSFPFFIPYSGLRISTHVKPVFC